MTAPFALLDDGQEGAGSSSRWYSDWCHAHVSRDASDLDACCEKIQADLAAGRHALLLADFEWGMVLQGVPVPPEVLAQCPRSPALVVHVFGKMERLEADQVEQRLAAHSPAAAEAPADVVGWRSNQDERGHSRAVEVIQEAIRAGETYQVNLTRRLSGRLVGDPVALFGRLRRAQPVAYGALLAVPDVTRPGAQPPLRWVLSHSPELLVEHRAERLRAQPMKGTAPADSDPAALARDPKNRAENLMIVDLLRNDLGRVAHTGSVQVSALFAVQRHPTLLQMTSTIHASLKPEATLADLLRAVFPCGSITGAPRRQTLRWISRLEPAPRGLYTGAVGWLDASQPPAVTRCPEAVLSVAIRTLELETGPAHTAARPDTRAVLGVGGGIVLDSQAPDEWQESALKARFVQTVDPGYTLFETLRVRRDATGQWQLAHAEQHLARLRASAQALGFDARQVQDPEALEALWRAAVLRAEGAAGQAGCPALRLRLDLARSGEIQAQAHSLDAQGPPPADGPDRGLGMVWAQAPLFSPGQPLLQAALMAHKTSWRPPWDAALRQAQEAGAFDALLWGHDAPGEAPFVVDGARSTVYACVDGVWLTPPVQDGALPGTVRARVLAGEDDTARQMGLVAVRVQRLSVQDAGRAQAWAVSNALRGVQRAHLTGAFPGGWHEL